VQTDHALIPNYLEEIIRLEKPAQGNYRKTTRETVLADVRLPKGSPLMLMWGSANRDEHEFENAGELILDRPNIKNHLGFGQGIYFCIGAALARLEARVAMEVFLSRCEKLTVHLTYQKPEYLPSLFIRRLSKLEVSFS
jgi:cytochrome P450